MGAFPIHKAWGLGAGWELKAALSSCNAGWSSMWISVTGPWHREGAFCTASALPELSPCPANTQLYPHHGWADGERAQLTTSPLGDGVGPALLPLTVSPLGDTSHMMWVVFVCFLRERLVKERRSWGMWVFFGGGKGRCWCSFLQASSFLPIPLFPSALKEEEIADLAKRMGEERRKTVERML